MSDYVDFVIVDYHGGKTLCVAPAFSHLKKSDKVMLDAGDIVDVIASDTFDNNDEDSMVKMILGVFDAKAIKDVPKLKGKVDFIDFSY